MLMHPLRHHPRVASFLRKPLPDKLLVLRALLYRLKGLLYYRRVFGSFGKGSVLYKPMLLGNPHFMHIGERVIIRDGVRLEAVMIDPDHPPSLHIGNNVNIEQDCHIVFLGRVRIADNVTLAGRCSLLCGSHPFLDVESPIKIGNRLTGSESVLEIGEGAFLGMGTVVTMNVRIGKRAVIGANAVVRRNIPDFSIAEGNPAVVQMRYDHEEARWKPMPKR